MFSLRFYDLHCIRAQLLMSVAILYVTGWLANQLANSSCKYKGGELLHTRHRWLWRTER